MSISPDRLNWAKTTLGALITLEYGKPLKAEDRDGQGYPVYGSAGEVGLHSTPLISRAPVIVVGRKGTAGSVWWSSKPCSVIDTAFYVEEKVELEARFLFLLLDFIDLPALTAQTGVPGLNRDRAYGCAVVIPPRNEQKRIVDVISSVEAYIAALKQQDEDTRTARNAVLHELLNAGGDDWTETTLGEIGMTGFLADGDWVESKDQDPAGSYRLLQLADIGDGFFLGKSNRWLNHEQFLRLRCTPLAPRDILIARMPDPIARACLVPADLAGAATVVDVAILRCAPAYFPEFLVLVINDQVFRAAAGSLISGTTRQRISRMNLARISFRLPSLIEQQRIVELVAAMDDVIRSTEQAISEAQMLRAGLLSDLLSGDHAIPETYDRLLGVA